MRRSIVQIGLAILAGTLALAEGFFPDWLPLLTELGPIAGEGGKMGVTLFVGHASLGQNVQSRPLSVWGGKSQHAMELAAEGAALAAAAAYLRATGQQPVMRLFVGRDAGGKIATAEIEKAFLGAKCLAVSAATAMSIRMPGEKGGDVRLQSAAQRLDIDQAKHELDPVWSKDLNQVVIGPLEASDHELLVYLLREAKQKGLRTFWLPSRSQILDRRRTLEALRTRVDVVQLSESDLTRLSDCGTPVAAINRLRDLGVTATILCTRNDKGVVAFDGRNWSTQPHFLSNSTGQAALELDWSDTFAGTMAGWLEPQGKRQLKPGLRLAVAAAAMGPKAKVEGWKSLELWSSGRQEIRPLVRPIETVWSQWIAPLALTIAVLLAMGMGALLSRAFV